MSLRDRINQKSTSLVRRETITLPATGEVVQVRGMMFGEKERVAELSGFKQSATMLALTVEDPETGKGFWNPNDQKSLDEIAALPIPDTQAIVEVINRLSGFSKEGNDNSPATESSPSSSSDSASEGEPSAS